MQPDPNASLDQFARITTIIAFAVAAAVPLYVLVAWVVAPQDPAMAGDRGLVGTLAIALGVVAVGTLIAAQGLFRTRVAAARRQATPEQRLATYRVAVIIALALKESVAIYGLVLSLLDGDPLWAMGFGVVALAAMTLSWPRRTEMEALAAEVPPIG